MQLDLDLAVDLTDKTKISPLKYRDTGSADAQSKAKEICEIMNIESKESQEHQNAD